MIITEKEGSVSQGDIIWGIGDISEAIGQSFAATAYMLKKGQIPARKVGERWVASRKKLNEFLTSEDAA